MWRVTLTGRDHKGQDYEHVVRIFSNRWQDLIENEHFRWEMLDELLKRGSLKRVHVDFRPNMQGSRKVRKEEDGLFYVFVNGAPITRGYADRGDAWAASEF